eukprot:scpid108751/ scgid5576/ 
MNDEANWPTQRQSLSCQPVAHSHTTPPYPLNTYTNVTVACAFSQHLPPQNSSHLTHPEAHCWALGIHSSQGYAAFDAAKFCLASGLGGSVGRIISGREDLGDEGTAKGPDAPKRKNDNMIKPEDLGDEGTAKGPDAPKSKNEKPE